MITSPDSGSELSETPEEIRHQVRGEYRIYLVIVSVVSLIVGGIMGITLFGKDQNDTLMEIGGSQPPLRQETAHIPTFSVEDRSLSVYVSGAVNTSQVVTVPQGSLVSDAIEAAGGASSEANLDAINLAAPLMNHDHILVPGYAEGRSTQTAKGLLDINTASASELEMLPNIGPARAQQIVIHRETHGIFQSKQDLMDVSGIGPVIYDQLAPFISVGGE